MQFHSRSLSKDLSVYFQDLRAFGGADEWTWLRLWPSSNTCPVRPCPSRNRISRCSHPVTLTDLPSTGSSWNSSWHTMTWDKADFNPFLWEILQPVHMEGPKKKIYQPVQVRQLMKILQYPWFHPALWPSTCTRARQGENNRNMTLWAGAWNLDSRGEIYLQECSFYFLESPKETVQRCDCTGWGDGGEFPQALFSRVNWTSTAFCEFRKFFISHEVCSYIPRCNRYLVPTCILTLSSMVRIRQFVEYAVRHRLYSLSHSHSLSQRQEGLCRVSV